MITATSSFDGPPLVFNVSVNGVPIYLGNDSLIELAKGDPARRQRFVNATGEAASDCRRNDPTLVRYSHCSLRHEHGAFTHR